MSTLPEADPLLSESPEAISPESEESKPVDAEEGGETAQETQEESSADTTTVTRHPSLASASRLSLLIPILTLCTHVLFYYGQTAPMWRLHVLRETYEPFWLNATSTKAKYSFDTLGLHRHQNITVANVDRTVKEFTYGYAISELWRMKLFLPRFTALLLVLCSGIWPHLKLILLNAVYLTPMKSLQRRRRFLHALSTLGKWSLADVLTVCVLIAVVRLDWIIDPEALRYGTMEHLDTIVRLTKQLYSSNDLCTLLLGYGCHKPKNVKHVTSCNACIGLVKEAYGHPSWAKSTGKDILKGCRTSGSGEARLDVIGMRGIYAFGLAVVCSILLSLVVDIVDTRDRRRRQLEERAAMEQAMQEPLLLEDGEPAPPVSTVTTVSHQSSPKSVLPALFTNMAALVVVCIATFSPTMMRVAEGAMPKLMHDLLDVQWLRPYSFRTLMETTGAAGGWDWLLMGTFSLFIVIGPLIRSLLGIFVVYIPSRFRRKVVMGMNFMGAFCAWEVLTIAVVMVDMQMPSVTNTIVQMPQCSVLSSNGSCVQIKYNILPSFAWVIIGGVLMVVANRMSWGLVQEDPEESTQDDLRFSTQTLESEYQALNETEPVVGEEQQEETESVPI